MLEMFDTFGFGFLYALIFELTMLVWTRSVEQEWTGSIRGPFNLTYSDVKRTFAEDGQKMRLTVEKPIGDARLYLIVVGSLFWPVTLVYSILWRLIHLSVKLYERTGK